MISIKDYAKKNNVSYEAVRKQVKTYAIELEPHIHTEGRTRYLDEEGEAFLDEKRSKSPIIILENDKQHQYEAVKEENEALKIKIMQLQDQIIGRDDKIMELTDKVMLLIEGPEELKEKDKALEKELQELSREKEIQELQFQKEKEELLRQLEDEKAKSWWDKLRGK